MASRPLELPSPKAHSDWHYYVLCALIASLLTRYEVVLGLAVLLSLATVALVVFRFPARESAESRWLGFTAIGLGWMAVNPEPSGVFSFLLPALLGSALYWLSAFGFSSNALQRVPWLYPLLFPAPFLVVPAILDFLRCGTHWHPTTAALFRVPFLSATLPLAGPSGLWLAPVLLLGTAGLFLADKMLERPRARIVYALPVTLALSWILVANWLATNSNPAQQRSASGILVETNHLHPLKLAQTDADIAASCRGSNLLIIDAFDKDLRKSGRLPLLAAEIEIPIAMVNGNGLDVLTSSGWQHVETTDVRQFNLPRIQSTWFARYGNWLAKLYLPAFLYLLFHGLGPYLSALWHFFQDE